MQLENMNEKRDFTLKFVYHAKKKLMSKRGVNNTDVLRKLIQDDK